MKQLTKVEREHYEIADERTILYIEAFRETTDLFSAPGM